MFIFCIERYNFVEVSNLAAVSLTLIITVVSIMIKIINVKISSFILEYRVITTDKTPINQ